MGNTSDNNRGRATSGSVSKASQHARQMNQEPYVTRYECAQEFYVQCLMSVDCSCIWARVPSTVETFERSKRKSNCTRVTH